MSILCVGASGKLDLFVSTFERDVKPSQERVDICNIRGVRIKVCLRMRVYPQSFRVADSEKGASKVRSSFLAVSKSMC